MTKREELVAAIEAAGTTWDCPTVGKETVRVVIMHADLAKALADGAKLALAMLDRMAGADVEEALK